MLRPEAGERKAPRRSLTRSSAARFARPNIRACQQAKWKHNLRLPDASFDLHFCLTSSKILLASNIFALRGLRQCKFSVLLFQMKVWDHRWSLKVHPYSCPQHISQHLSIDIQLSTSLPSWNCTTACNFGSLDVVILKGDLFLVSLWIDVCHFLEPAATN